jgi:GH15 family glucan-1,4-alpha-glucosidase
MNKKIRQLIQSSQKIIFDCALENGAIVAANSTKKYYPKEAKNYFYVWPRDAAFTCLAADIIGISNIQENFFNWLEERAEGWQETGLFYEKYYPNGAKALLKFQPDQTGIIIYVVCRYLQKNKNQIKKFKKLIMHSADGICNVWNKDHFNIVTNDLWEERLTFPDIKDNFSYSLAACIQGLIHANKLFPDKKYEKTAEQMKTILLKSVKKDGYFYRSFGILNDKRIDASSLGIIWPFEIVKPSSKLVQQTIKTIENKLAKNFEVKRYENDEYDGWMYENSHRMKGAGYWSLLNFWMAIVLSKMNQKKKALKYYNHVLDSLDNNFIPEQIFNNKMQKSISPLCWSHTMFILATEELGLLKK